VREFVGEVGLVVNDKEHGGCAEAAYTVNRVISVRKIFLIKTGFGWFG
jgi:hypothetical protein